MYFVYGLRATPISVVRFTIARPSREDGHLIRPADESQAELVGPALSTRRALRIASRQLDSPDGAVPDIERPEFAVESVLRPGHIVGDYTAMPHLVSVKSMGTSSRKKPTERRCSQRFAPHRSPRFCWPSPICATRNLAPRRH